MKAERDALIYLLALIASAVLLFWSHVLVSGLRLLKDGTGWKPLCSTAEVQSENKTNYVRKIFIISDYCPTEKDSQFLSLAT